MEGRRDKTCGPLFDEVRERWGRDMLSFAAGFATGLAEKVYLGAAQAAMFRPSRVRYGEVLGIITDVASTYGLITKQYIYENPETRGLKWEVWYLRDSSVLPLFERMALCTINGVDWHTFRAQLCGIPEGEVDVEFHKRRR